MKKILLTATILLPFMAYSQKLQKPVVDKISGETTLSTSKDKLYVHGNVLTQQGEAVECLVEKKGQVVTLILIPQTLNEKVVFTVAKGQKAYLKSTNGSMVTLASDSYLISDSKVDQAGGVVYSNGLLRVPYVLSAEDIEKLKTLELSFLRIETSTGNFDCDIKPKYADVIKKQLTLITDAK